MGKRGPKLKIKKKDFIKAIPSTGGLFSLIAKKLGVDRQTVQRYFDKRDTTGEIRLALFQEKESIKDLAESKLIKKISGEDLKAIKWFLATQAKDRGYIHKQEIDLSANVVAKINTSLTENEKKELLRDLNNAK